MKSNCSPTTRRAESQLKTREALLNAGAALIAKHGYAGASVRDIASHAGYTQGAFYSNFQSKDDLILAIMRTLFQEAYDSISAIENSGVTTPAALAREATIWLENICRSDEKALLEAEFSLHAMRDAEFAESYHALLNEHATMMTLLMTKISEARSVAHRAPVDHVAKGMIAMARGLKLMMPGHDRKVMFEILRVFLEAILEQSPEGDATKQKQTAK